jgi:hypothetical protein
MILPRSGAGLPPWRRLVMPWIMALARLTAGWIVTQGALGTLLRGSSFMASMAAAPLRYGIAALLGAGLVTFAWPRTYLLGFGLLLAGLGAFEWLWWRLGVPSGSPALWSAAILGVLAAGEWLTRRVQARVYAR